MNALAAAFLLAWCPGAEQMALEEDMILEFELEDDRASWGSECLSMIPVVNVLVQSTTNVSFWTMTITVNLTPEHFTS